MWKKISRAVLALTVVVALGAAGSEPAEAGRGRNVAAGVAVGTLLGLGIAGAYAGPRYYGPGYYYGPAHYGPGCYRGPRQCGWAGRSCWRNPYGEMICRGGEWRCWRPTICD
jgi:hypothetical protein